MFPTPLPSISALCHLRFSLCFQPRSLAYLGCRLAGLFSPYQFFRAFSAFLFLLQPSGRDPCFYCAVTLGENTKRARQVCKSSRSDQLKARLTTKSIREVGGDSYFSSSSGCSGGCLNIVLSF